MADYDAAMTSLMSQLCFRCHIWCYNMPLALAIFTLLLVVCLTLLPWAETALIYGGRESGFELIHGSIVWLVVLTAYMLVTHIARSKVRWSGRIGACLRH